MAKDWVLFEQTVFVERSDPKYASFSTCFALSPYIGVKETHITFWKIATRWPLFVCVQTAVIVKNV